MSKPTAEQIERGRTNLRRQGMADAAVRLLALGANPAMDLTDYAVALDLTGDDIRAAIARRNGHDPLPGGHRTPPPIAPPPSGPAKCPVDGCDASFKDGRGLASHQVAAHTPPVDCPGGCGRQINPRGLGPHLAHCTGPAAAS